MIETSKDILYLVIAFSVLLVTIFLIWIMYYLAMILKQGKEMVNSVRKKIDAIDEILHTIKEKVTSSAAILTALARGITDLIGFFKNRKEAREEKQEEKKKKK